MRARSVGVVTAWLAPRKFGFIAPKSPNVKSPLFAHYSEVRNVDRTLKPGSHVEFDIKWVEEHQNTPGPLVPIAGNITAVGGGPPDPFATPKDLTGLIQL